MAEDDPFSCFGSDDEDDDEEEEVDDQNEERLKLIQIVNSKRTVEAEGSPNESATATTTTYASIETNANFEAPMLWADFKPLYMGPMKVATIDDYGGGRGYIASRDLEPGTLLLVEEPIFTWPDDQIGKELGLQSISSLLSDPHPHYEKNQIIWAIEELHPSKCDVDQAFAHDKTDNNNPQVYDMMQKLQNDYKSEIHQSLLQNLIKLAQKENLHNSDNSLLRERDLLRMLLTLRYNGFGSGLYLHFSIFNHDCDPNCIKFLPSSTRKYSEIRTTKHIKCGEPLTLHYLEPREVSHATRRQHLMEQHLFDIGDQIMSESLRQMELIDGIIPVSQALSPMSFPLSKETDSNPKSQTARIEKTLEDMEEMKLELSLAVKLITEQFQNPTSQPINNDGVVETFERLKALEQAVLEVCFVATHDSLRNNQHILMIRCLRLHMDTVELLLQSASGDDILTFSQRYSLMSRFTKSAQELLELQILLLGSHHPDVARTYLDLANSIQSVLSSAPTLLFDLGAKTKLTNFTQWSKEEARCTKEYKRISSMYPMDVDKYIKNKD